MKRLTFLITLILAIVVLFGCKKEEEKVIAEPDQEPVEEIDEEDETEKEYTNVFPLTGLGTDDPVDYRPFGVMIENSSSARPQTGLYQADIVYEVLSEGSITRFLAFYHSEKPERIGPVRSARDYYIKLNNGYNGIYVSAGWSPAAREMIQSGQADHVNGLTYDGRYFTRAADRKAPHNLYTSYEDLMKAADHAKLKVTGEAPTQLFLNKDSMISGAEVNDIVIEYGSDINQVSYKYESETAKYLRFNGGIQTIDKEVEIPVLLDNIFIVETAHRVIPGDSAGRREVELSSGGNGVLFQKGIAIEVGWENVDGQIIPMKNGQAVGFVPGKTWINFVGSLENVSFK